jgi:hypothetical protein
MLKIRNSNIRVSDTEYVRCFLPNKLDIKGTYSIRIQMYISVKKGFHALPACQIINFGRAEIRADSEKSAVALEEPQHWRV